MAKTTEDEYVVLSADETVRLVEMPARSLVHEMLVEQGIIPECDADYYQNGCLIVAWKLGGKYDPERLSKRTGERCTYKSYLKFVMKAYLIDVRREIANRGKLKMVSLDADPDTLDQIEADAIREILLAGTTADHDEMMHRLELEDAADALKEPYRTAARLRYVEGLSLKETARRMNVSLATVTHKYGTKLDEKMAAQLKMNLV